MFRKRKRLLKKSVIISVFFFSVLYRPCCLEAVYEITETELTAIEENNRIILDRLEKSEKELEKSEKKLEIQEKELEKSEKKLEIQEKELETLEQQLQTQAEYYRKLEREKKLLIKWGIPTAVIVAAGCFAGGLILGLRL